MPRWPIVIAGLLVALAAGLALLTTRGPGDPPPSYEAEPHADIGEASRRALERVLREGERLDEAEVRKGLEEPGAPAPDREAR